MLKSEEWSFHSLWRVGAVGAPRRFIKSKVNQKILELFLLPADDELFAYGWFADRVINSPGLNPREDLSKQPGRQ